VNDFFSFDKMITPAIIKIVFWIGLIVSVLAGLGLILAGFGTDDGGGGLIVVGLAYLVLGPIVVRVYCELIIILFRMHESLREIRNNTAPSGSAPALAPATPDM